MSRKFLEYKTQSNFATVMFDIILRAFPTRATRLSSLGVGVRGASERLAG